MRVMFAAIMPKVVHTAPETAKRVKSSEENLDKMVGGMVMVMVIVTVSTVREMVMIVMMMIF